MTLIHRLPLVGFAYGCVLFVFAFGSAGFGTGSYLPFAVYGAPLSLIPLAGLFVAPVWWGLLGYCLRRRSLGATLSMLAVHVAAVALVLWLGNPWESGDDQWRYFRRTQQAIPIVLWGGVLVYVFGQVAAWVLAIRGFTRQRLRPD